MLKTIHRAVIIAVCGFWLLSFLVSCAALFTDRETRAEQQGLSDEGEASEAEVTAGDAEAAAAGSVEDSEAGASEDAAERQFKLYFLFEKIAEKEKIFITENDVENRIAALANSYRQSAQQVRGYLEEQNALPQLRIQMREERVISELLEKAEIQDAES